MKITDMDAIVAIPAPPEQETQPDVLALRRELADALTNAAIADKAARAAKAIADRADAAKHEAARAADRLKQSLDEKQAAATREHAEACADAFRAGAECPTADVPPVVDTSALSRALAHLTSLHITCCGLDSEYQKAAQSASAAQVSVSALVDEIMLHELYQIAEQAVADIEAHWAQVDTIKGMVMVDEKRSGGPRLRGFQERFLERIERQKSCIASDPRMVERGYYNGHLVELAAEQERRWLDFRRRLMGNPAAMFGDLSS